MYRWLFFKRKSVDICFGYFIWTVFGYTQKCVKHILAFLYTFQDTINVSPSIPSPFWTSLKMINIADFQMAISLGDGFMNS